MLNLNEHGENVLSFLILVVITLMMIFGTG